MGEDVAVIEIVERLYVSGQITLDDIAAAKARGVTLIINNRPDGESPDQPTHAEMAAAAAALGLACVHIPVIGAPDADAIAAMRTALAAHDGAALAFCRSGTRSITAWALGELASGARPSDEVADLVARAGYDPMPILARAGLL